MAKRSRLGRSTKLMSDTPARAQRIYAERGAQRKVDAPLPDSFYFDSIASSSDGRWLFVVGDHQRLYAVDATTGHVHGLRRARTGHRPARDASRWITPSSAMAELRRLNVAPRGN
jgi:hypothetical protein